MINDTSLAEVLRTETAPDNLENIARNLTESEYADFVISMRDQLLSVENPAEAQRIFKGLMEVFKNKDLFPSSVLRLYKISYNKILLDLLLVHKNLKSIPLSERNTKKTLVDTTEFVTKIRDSEESMQKTIVRWWLREVGRSKTKIVRRTNKELALTETIPNNEVLNKRLRSEYCSFLSRNSFTKEERNEFEKVDQFYVMSLIAFEQLRNMIIDRAMKNDEEIGITETPLEIKDKYSIVIRFGSYAKKVFISKDAVLRGNFSADFNQELSGQLQPHTLKIIFARYSSTKNEKSLDESMSKLGFIKSEPTSQKWRESVENSYAGTVDFSNYEESLEDPQDITAADLAIGISTYVEAIPIQDTLNDENWMTWGGRIPKVIRLYYGPGSSDEDAHSKVLAGALVKTFHPNQDGQSHNSEFSHVMLKVKNRLRKENKSIEAMSEEERPFKGRILLSNPEGSRESYEGPFTPSIPVGSRETIGDKQRAFRTDIDGNTVIRSVLEEGKLHDLYKENFDIKLSITHILTILSMITTTSEDAHFLEFSKDTKQLVPTLFNLPTEMQKLILSHEKGDKISHNDFFYFLSLLGSHQFGRKLVREKGFSEVSGMGIMAGRMRNFYTKIANTLRSKMPNMLQNSILVSTQVATTKASLESEHTSTYQREFSSAPADQYLKGAFSACDAGNGKINIIHLIDAGRETPYQTDAIFSTEVKEKVKKIMDFLVDGAEQYAQAA